MDNSRSSRDVQISKALSYLLRHGAEKEGLRITKDGFVKVEDVLTHKSLRNVSEENIVKVVNNCPKKRFHLQELQDEQSQTTKLFIRANQGHSIKDLDVEMVEITNQGMEECLHGTYYKFLESIKTQGLSRMNRQHIHLSEDFPGLKSVISGMRSNCEIAIYIDAKKAMLDGIKFYRSTNNVILSPGDESGFLKPKYFSKIVDIKTSKII